MIHKQLHTGLFFAVLLVPTREAGTWVKEKYSKIPEHTVNFSNEGLRIQIKESSSPLFFPLPKGPSIKSFRIEGEFHGLPQLIDTKQQGEKGADDYPLRVGFIIPGNKQLSGLQRLLAPDWVMNIYAKIPKGQGLDHVHFFNITQNPSQVNSSRVHPLSELIQEEFIAVVTKPGPFRYDYKLKQPFAAVALWISSDGDDTKSSYEVVISKLELHTDP